MRATAPLVAALAGVVATATVAVFVEMSAAEAWHLAALAGVAAAVTGLLGLALLELSRGRSIGAQVAIVAVTSVAAVAVGAVTAAGRMFISRHDLTSLAVVLVAAVAVGTVIALALGGRVATASRSLGILARRIGEGEPVAPIGDVPTEELARLGRELDTMSARLTEARERERSLEASRRELVAWVSHDLRTPLAGIRAMVEAIEDSVVTDAESIARYHRALRVETDRLSGLVDDLFELSRINAGTLRLEMERVSLGDLVSDALSGAAGVARAKGVRLEGHLAGDAPELELSAAEMARVIRNLLENAIRHTPGDGTVWVEAGAEHEHAFVSVNDACGGIPSSDLDRVFDVAFRGEAARSPAGDGGAGLGLAIARGIVEAHDGEIAVSNEGAGCRFVVRIPLIRDGEGSRSG